ncbi:MAG: aldehyde dehydrogenase [Eubacteriales bacterium]|nr:aldehyde dehydrogenase [Eubacteriales bacterium]
MRQEEIQKTYQAAKDFFATKQTLTLEFRQESLAALEKAIKRYEKELYGALKQDLNKSEHEAYVTELSLLYDELRLAQKKLKSWARPKRVKPTLAQLPGSVRVQAEPYGVALIMSPWNYPVLLTLNPLLGAIAAGNVCLVKPSAYSPATSSVLARLIHESLPAGLAYVIEGGREENSSLLDLPFDYIFFTGSPGVGRLVMEKASRHLTPVTLELGGRSPVIVDETADIAKTARRLTFGKLTNAGQTCIAPNHVFVQRTVAEELKDNLVENFQHSFPNEAYYRAYYPQIINEKHYQRLLNLLEGQNIVVGGKANAATLQIEPTIVMEPLPDAPLMQEEIFGPILPLVIYDDLVELLDRIRKEPKPLALYYFTSRKDLARRVLSEVSFGGGCINDCLVHIATPYAPFGGVGNSGMGNYHGEASFRAFSHYKTVVHKAWQADVELRYHPFDAKKLKWAKRLLG